MQDLPSTQPDSRAPDTTARADAWLIDAAIAAAFMLAVLAAGWPQRSGMGSATAPLIALPLAGRRRWPLACFAVQLLGVALTGPPSSAPLPIMLALAVGEYSAVGVSGLRPRLLVGAGTVGVILLMHFSTDSGGSVLLLATAWLLAFPYARCGYAPRPLSITAGRYAASTKHSRPWPWRPSVPG